MFDKLAAPFPPEKVHWRVQNLNEARTRGMAVCYLDARDVMDRLDEVVGPAGWQTRFEEVANRVVCSIGIFCCAGVPPRDDIAEWTWKADGAGDFDIEPEKGALSDSFKRAAVHWGIGRYLYRIPSEWVDTEPVGKKGARITPGACQKLGRLLPGSVVPQPAAAPGEASNGHAEPAAAQRINAAIDHVQAVAKGNGRTPEAFAAKVLSVQPGDVHQLDRLEEWLDKHGEKAFGVPRTGELGQLLTRQREAVEVGP